MARVKVDGDGGGRGEDADRVLQHRHAIGALLGRQAVELGKRVRLDNDDGLSPVDPGGELGDPVVASGGRAEAAG